MNDLVLKQETFDKFLNEHFDLTGSIGKELNDQNMPGYVHTLNNFQDFLVTMDRKDWNRSLQISSNKYFANNLDAIDQASGPKSKVKSIDNRISPAQFNDVANMHAFVEQSSAKFRDRN